MGYPFARRIPARRDGVPEGSVELEGEALRYQETRIRRMQMSASLANGERAQLRMTADGLESGDTRLGQLQLNATGSPDAHQADLQLQGGLLDLSLAAQGGMRGGDWHGRLTNVEVEAQRQQWALQQPVEVVRLQTGQLDLAPRAGRIMKVGRSHRKEFPA